MSSMHELLQSYAVGVFSPRTNPSARGTSRLRSCNRAFLDLCDVTHFESPSLVSLMAENPAFTDAVTAQIAGQSWARCVSVVDAMHKGEIDGAIMDFLHISRTGRVKWVQAELQSIRADGLLKGFLFITVPSPNTPPSMITTTAIIRSPTVVPPITSPPSPPAQTPKVAALPQPTGQKKSDKPALQWKEENGRKGRERGVSSAFQCEICQITETVQRRRGPNGAGTLCNRCGLKWRLLQKENTKFSAVLSDALMSDASIATA